MHTLEYIFPPSCGVCGKLGKDYLCEKCEKELRKYEIDLEQDLVEEDSDKIIRKLHIFKYKELIRKLIIQYKFDDKSHLYKTFCKFIVKNEKLFDFIKSYDIIVPVPIHKKRMRERGYNQSELIAKDLAKTAGIRCYTDVLVKIKNNKPQSSLNGNDRKENAKDVYKLVKKEKITNKKVLLFDDIYTTGATVSACIKELGGTETKQIGVLTLARD